MAKYKVYVTDDRHKDYEVERKLLEEIGAHVEVKNCTTVEECKRELKDADALLANLAPLTEEVIGALDNCKIISRYGVGYENVDTKAAADKGIWVSNVPGYCAEDVSDHIIALLFSMVRFVPYRDRLIRQGRWNIHMPMHRVRGCTLGIIGYGAIGKTLHRKLAAVGFSKVYIYDPYLQEGVAIPEGGELTDLDTLLRNSDFVSVNAPLTDETYHLINRNRLSLMKRSAKLINTARGGLVDTGALIEALQKGTISFAGLDVHEQEPLHRNSPLLTMDNVILTDHVGYFSEESVVDLKTGTAMNIIAVLQGKEPLHPVNRPSISS